MNFKFNENACEIAIDHHKRRIESLTKETDFLENQKLDSVDQMDIRAFDDCIDSDNKQILFHKSQIVKLEGEFAAIRS